MKNNRLEDFLNGCFEVLSWDFIDNSYYIDCACSYRTIADYFEKYSNSLGLDTTSQNNSLLNLYTVTVTNPEDTSDSLGFAFFDNPNPGDFVVMVTVEDI